MTVGTGSTYRDSRPTRVGELVYHLLYGTSWRAIIVDLKDFEQKCKDKRGFCREYILVHMQKGTEYDRYFRGFLAPMRKSDSSGLVSYHWLRVLDFETR